jgi:hypothetical protein
MGFSVRLRQRLRWSTLGVCVGVPIAIVLLSGCAVGGEACSLSGSASFTPGLKTARTAVNYTFTGSFTGCRSALGDPTITSGNVTASGGGPSVGCTGGNTSGSATVAWNNGQTSVIAITTSGALNAVAVTGKVTSGEFVGRTFHAVLAFTVADPTACNNATGVTSATFKGATAPA